MCDKIYDSALVDEAQIQLPNGPHAIVRFRAATDLLLASKKVREDYKDRADRNMQLLLRDHAQYRFKLVQLPEQARVATVVELHIILFCHHCENCSYRCDVEDSKAAQEVEDHRPWIVDLLSQLTRLRALYVHSYLCYDKYRANSTETVPCQGAVERKIEELFQLPKLKELILYRYDYTSNPGFDGPKEAILKWTDGLKENLEDKPSIRLSLS